MTRRRMWRSCGKSGKVVHKRRFPRGKQSTNIRHYRRGLARNSGIGQKYPMPINRAECAKAARYLQRQDPALGRVIRQVGPCTLRRRRDRFASLVQSIISQQVSTQAAATIGRRLTNTAGGRVRLETLTALTDQSIRAAGVSPQKLRYLRDLCSRVDKGELQLSRLGYLSDHQVIHRLTEVKGIGEWTAQMFLIFVLGRSDVLPCADLGVQNAMRDLYELSDRPSPQEMEAIARPWRPYASIGSWYCWRFLD